MPLESWDEAFTEQKVGRDKRSHTEERPERRKSRERGALQATFKEGAISCVCLGSRETGLGAALEFSSWRSLGNLEKSRRLREAVETKA